MNKVVINESKELPILSGLIEVDTSKTSITILFNRIGKKDSMLTISKITNDNNIISLFSDKYLIQGSEIIIFGVPQHANVKKGKINTIVLRSDGKNWNIIKEY